MAHEARETELNNDSLSKVRNGVGDVFSGDLDQTVNPLNLNNEDSQEGNDQEPSNEQTADPTPMSRVDNISGNVPSTPKISVKLPVRMRRSKQKKFTSQAVPQRVTSMGVGYLGVSWPSRDSIAIEKSKQIEKRQKNREKSAKLRLVEKATRDKQMQESVAMSIRDKRQEVLKYQYEEKQRLDRLAKLAERERGLVESCAARQKAKLLELKSGKAKLAQVKRDEVRNKQKAKLSQIKVKKNKFKAETPQISQIGVKDDGSSGRTLDGESMASTITTKATEKVAAQETDEADELFASIRETTLAAEKQLEKEGAFSEMRSPKTKKKTQKKGSAFSRVQERLNEMDDLLRKLRERERGQGRTYSDVPKAKKRTRPMEGSWMKPTVSSSMATLSPRTFQERRSPVRKCNREPSSDGSRTKSVATKSVHSRQSFEEYYHSKYKGSERDDVIDSVSHVMEAQDEQQLLDEAGSMLAASILHPTAPSVGGYTWEALSHAMGFAKEGNFNEVRERGEEVGLYLKVNSLRDALSVRFRPTMHDLDTIRPTASFDDEEVANVSNFKHTGIFSNDPAFSQSLSSTTSAWEELVALTANDAVSVKSHVTA